MSPSHKLDFRNENHYLQIQNPARNPDLDFVQQLADGMIRLSFNQSRFRTPLEYDESRFRSPIDLHQHIYIYIYLRLFKSKGNASLFFSHPFIGSISNQLEEQPNKNRSLALVPFGSFQVVGLMIGPALRFGKAANVMI